MPEYALEISDAEIGRYQMMARNAVAAESAQLAAAGVAAGVTVADIGCGPAAMSIEIARLVGPSGWVIGVDSDPAALVAARALIRRPALPTSAYGPARPPRPAWSRAARTW